MVAHTVTIRIGRAVSAASANGVFCQTRSVIVGGRSAVVAGERVGAAIDFRVVADAVAIGIGRAGTSTDAQGVELVSIAVAVSRGNSGATTVIDFAGSIADATGVQVAHAGVYVVAHAVSIRIGRAAPAARSKNVSREARPVIFGGISIEVAAEGIRASWDFIDITHPVGIDICGAGASTNTEGVELISVAIAVADGPLHTTTLEHRSRSIAQAAFIQCADTRIHIVTILVAIAIGRAPPAADAHDIEIQAVPIVLRGIRVVVARIGVGTASEDALAGDVGLWIIVIRFGVGTARVETTGIHIGLRIEVVRVRVGAAGVLTLP